MTQEQIKALEGKGFSRWQKAGMDRLYINATQLGLNCEYYKTGNVKNAEFRGVQISNSEANRMRAAKTYIDVNTGRVYSGNSTLKSAVEEMLEGGERE